MSSPLVAGSWWGQVNVPFNDTSTAPLINKSWMHALKEMLKGTITLSGTSTSSSLRPEGSKWTVVGSSDGTTALLDGIDRLTGTVPNSFDSTKWVQAVSGTAHSWIVLKSPDALGPLWFCIDGNSATTTTWGLIVSREAFVLTAPLHTASRPHTNKGMAPGLGASEPIQTTNLAIIADNTTAQVHRAHIAVDASGAFHFMTSRNGQQCFNAWLSLFRSVDTTPDDTMYNYFMAYDNSTQIGQGSPVWNTVAQTAARVGRRSVDGETPIGAGGFCYWGFGASNFSFTATVDVSASVTGSHRLFPPYIQDLTTQAHSWRGRMPDAWVIGNAFAPGDQYPGPSDVSMTVVGDLLIPLTLSASL